MKKRYLLKFLSAVLILILLGGNGIAFAGSTQDSFLLTPQQLHLLINANIPSGIDPMSELVSWGDHKYAAEIGEVMLFACTTNSEEKLSMVTLQMNMSDQNKVLNNTYQYSFYCGAFAGLLDSGIKSEVIVEALDFEDFYTEGIRKYRNGNRLYLFEVEKDTVTYRIVTESYYNQQDSGQDSSQNQLMNDEDGVKLVVNGRSLALDVSPQIINGRTLVPVRGVLEELGASVEWVSKTREVIAVKDGKTITEKTSPA